MPDAKFIADQVARFLSCALISTGVLYHFAPVGGAHFFGITTAQRPDDQAIFIPALGARNAAQGVLALTFSLSGQRRATGIVMLSLILNGVADTRLCLLYGEKWLRHVVNIGIVTVVGTTLVR